MAQKFNFKKNLENAQKALNSSVETTQDKYANVEKFFSDPANNTPDLRTKEFEKSEFVETRTTPQPPQKRSIKTDTKIVNQIFSIPKNESDIIIKYRQKFAKKDLFNASEIVRIALQALEFVPQNNLEEIQNNLIRFKPGKKGTSSKP